MTPLTPASHMFSHFIICITAILLPLHLLHADVATKQVKLPDYRVNANGFNSSEQSIKKVCDYTIRPLWKNFPGYKLEPIVVTRGHNGPIVLYQRNSNKEIVVRLDTSTTYWCQYAYQWAHEFCHILCGYRNDGRENKWFEETICEMASLYCMRAMVADWKAKPPFGSKTYHKSIKSYIDNVIKKREKIQPNDLGKYYQKHKDALRKSSTLRDLNGAMAASLLPMFEENPENWEAVRYLNKTPAKPGITLKEYFTKWYKDAPKKHHKLIKKIAEHYGI